MLDIPGGTIKGEEGASNIVTVITIKPFKTEQTKEFAPMALVSDAKYTAVTKIEIDREAPQEGDSRKWGTTVCTVFLLVTGIAAVVLRVQMDVLSVYQLLFSVFCLMVTQTIGTMFVPSLYDGHYVAKILTICAVLFIVYSLPTYFPWNAYVTIARIGGFAYIIVQQLLILDFAFSWNHDWVNRSSVGSRILSGVFAGSDLELLFHSPWLLALFVISLLYGACFVAVMSYLYGHFGGPECRESNSIIAITVVLMLLALILQLRGSSGSILTSGIVSVYVAYLCYSCLSLNPLACCNPSIHQADMHVASTTIGVLLAFLSTAWTCVITTRRLSAGLTTGALQSALLGVASGRSESSSSWSWCGCCCGKFFGMCCSDKEHNNYMGEGDNIAPTCETNGPSEASYKGLRVAIVNAGVVFALVPLYLSMALSNWGTAQRNAATSGAADGGDQAATNPEVGARSMWVQAAGLWCCLGLYILSLVLPECRIFPRSIWDLQPRLA